MRRYWPIFVVMALSVAMMGAFKPGLGGGKGRISPVVTTGSLSHPPATAAAIETTTVAITFKSDGYWDITPSVWASGGVAPKFRHMRNVDSVYVDTDATYVRYYDLDGAAATSCASDLDYAVKFRSGAEGSFNAPNTEVACIWFDFKSFVPANSKIIQANFPVRIAFTAAHTLSGDDACYAVLDTVAADSLWLDAPRTFCGSIWEADVSWDYVGGYAAASDPWVPDLDDRDYSWQDGILGAPTHVGETITSGGTTDTLNFDVTRPIQLALEYGLPNNGFIIRIDETSPGEYQWRMGSNANNVGLNPTLYITYTNENYTGPWAGYETAVVFRTDDGEDVNVDYGSIEDGYGEKFSFAVPLSLEEEGGGAGNLTWAQVQALRQAGHDMVFHGGPEAGEITNGLGGIETPADDDSLYVILSRERLAELSGVAAADTNAIKVFSQPYGTYGADAIETMAAMGYLGSITIGYGRLDTRVQLPAWFHDGTVAAQQSDIPNYVGPGREMNLYCATTAYDASWVTLNSDTTGVATVNNRMMRAVGYVNKGDYSDTFPVNGTAIMISAHEDSLGVGYTTGIVTKDQLGWIEEWCDLNPLVRRMTLSEMFGIIRANATAIDAPAWANGNHSDVTASDGIYWYWPPPVVPPFDVSWLPESLMKWGSDYAFESSGDSLYDIASTYPMFQYQAESYTRDEFDINALLEKNPDIQVGLYVSPNGYRQDWSDDEAGSFTRAFHDINNAHQALDKSGNPWSPWDGAWMTDFVKDSPVVADSAAIRDVVAVWTYYFRDMPVENCHFMFDYMSVPQFDYYLANGDSLDLDQDGLGHHNDVDEQAALTNAYLYMTDYIREMVPGVKMISNGEEPYYNADLRAKLDGQYVEESGLNWPNYGAIEEVAALLDPDNPNSFANHADDFRPGGFSVLEANTFANGSHQEGSIYSLALAMMLSDSDHRVYGVVQGGATDTATTHEFPDWGNLHEWRYVGSPTGAYYEAAEGVYKREFQNGTATLTISGDGTYQDPFTFLLEMSDGTVIVHYTGS